MRSDQLIDRLQGILREVGDALSALKAEGPVRGEWLGDQLKSDADLVAEFLISRELGKLSPNLPVVSEEDLSSHASSWPLRYWLVDPIDGTASYCEGYSGFVTQIALMEYGLPVLAIVFGPALDLMYVGEKGSGAFLNGARLGGDRKADEIVLIDNYPTPCGVAAVLYQKLPCARYVESGSLGLKICRVAEGIANLFVKDVMTRNWDLAPGHLILEESGGVLADLSAGDITYTGSVEQDKGLIARDVSSVG